MKKQKSLQEIQDRYEAAGFSGRRLLRALEGDKEYQKLLQQKKREITSTITTTTEEKKKYPLPLNEDYIILSLCRELEQRALSAADRQLVALAKTQLEHEWRTHLIKTLRKLKEKYTSETPTQPS